MATQIWLKYAFGLMSSQWICNCITFVYISGRNAHGRPGQWMSGKRLEWRQGSWIWTRFGGIAWLGEWRLGFSKRTADSFIDA